jgi:hypothetical protein
LSSASSSVVFGTPPSVPISIIRPCAIVVAIFGIAVYIANRLGASVCLSVASSPGALSSTSIGLSPPHIQSCDVAECFCGYKCYKGRSERSLYYAVFHLWEVCHEWRGTMSFLCHPAPEQLIGFSIPCSSSCQAITFQHARFDPRTVLPVASRYTDWATRPTLMANVVANNLKRAQTLNRVVLLNIVKYLLLLLQQRKRAVSVKKLDGWCFSGKHSLLF